MAWKSGDLVILVRPSDSPDERYPNRWVGRRLDVLATHQKVVNAIKKALASGHKRIFLQVSPGGRVIGSAEIGGMQGAGDVWSVTFAGWTAMDEAAPGRSCGASCYGVG
jgi:hypothetical protein